MSDAARTFRMPPQVIVLDLLGTLLLLLGAFDLMDAQLPGPLSAAVKGYGHYLVAAGIALMILGAVLLVMRLAAGRNRVVDAAPHRPAPVTTVDRRAR